MWEKFKIDFKERFLNFETAKGMYLVPAGAAMLYAAIYYIAFVIQVSFGLLGLYMVIEGLRKTFVNRVKQSLNKDKMKATRLENTGEPTVSPKVPAPE